MFIPCFLKNIEIIFTCTYLFLWIIVLIKTNLIMIPDKFENIIVSFYLAELYLWHAMKPAKFKQLFYYSSVNQSGVCFFNLLDLVIS